MSRKRRVLIMTEAEWSAVRQAMNYVTDMHGMGEGDGDVDDKWGASNERVMTKIVDVAPMRDAQADADALVKIANLATISACSCVDRKIMDAGHNKDCAVRTHKREFDRLFEIRDLFLAAVK